MTVKELIEELEGCDPKAEVRYAYDYGDHCRHYIAASVEYVEENVTVAYSAYVREHCLMDEDDDPDKAEDVQTAVILSDRVISIN